MKFSRASLAFFCLLAFSQWCFGEGPASQTPLAKRLDFSGEPELSDDQKVNDWVAGALADKLGIDGNNALKKSDTRFARSNVVINKHAVVALDQKYKNITVAGLESRLVLDETSKPLFLLGQHKNFDADYTNKVELGLDAALQKAGHVKESEFEHRIVYWSDDYEALFLSYELIGEFVENEKPAASQKVYVDAVNGKILQRISLQHSAKNRQVNDFGAACNSMNMRIPINSFLATSVELVAAGRFSRRETSSTSGAGGNTEQMNRAFNLLGDGYDFIHQVIGMDSIDGRGRLLNVFINVKFSSMFGGSQCVGEDFNATWASHKQALYIPEEGLELVEVTLHELGHGIVSNGSGLEYLHQSGALNESIADAIGVSFRIWQELGKKSTKVSAIPKSYWSIRGPGRVMRSISYPKSVNGKVSFPDHFSEYLRWSANTDGGGVHYNSSIMNMGFYLLAQGGQHPRLKQGASVKGIGVFKAVKIYAQAGAALLHSRASFEDARFAFARAAELLYGKNSQERESVHMAMDAIGIPGTWEKTRITPPPEEEPQREEEPQPEEEKQPEPAPNEEPQPEKEPQREEEPQPEKEPQREEEPQPTQEPESNETDSDSNRLVILMMLGCAGLIAAGIIIFKMRPLAEINIQPVKNNEDKPQEVAVSKSNPVFAVLKSLEGQQLLPLNTNLLLGAEGLVIGRAYEVVHIQMESQRVSRRHVRIRMVNNTLTVEDLNSSRGTQVDGKQLQPFVPVEFKNGQLLRIAEFSYFLNVN